MQQYKPTWGLASIPEEAFLSKLGRPGRNPNWPRLEPDETRNMIVIAVLPLAMSLVRPTSNSPTK
jgi:hypothetical protein